jgi:hypothetical protein
MAPNSSPAYLYEMYPIDVWRGWILIQDALADPDKFDLRRSDLEERVAEVKKLLSEHTKWEGDGNIYLSSIPYEPETRLVFAIKQSNNGTTYIASPLPYVHLEKFLVYGPSF